MSMESVLHRCKECSWAGSTPQVLAAHVRQFHPPMLQPCVVCSVYTRERKYQEPFCGRCAREVEVQLPLPAEPPDSEPVQTVADLRAEEYRRGHL